MLPFEDVWTLDARHAETAMRRAPAKRAPERSVDEALRIMDSLRRFRLLINH
jgi:hypothetical protein